MIDKIKNVCNALIYEYIDDDGFCWRCGKFHNDTDSQTTCSGSVALHLLALIKAKSLFDNIDDVLNHTIISH